MRKFLKRVLITAGGVAAAVTAERFLLAGPRYRGPLTDHFDGEQFHNLEPGTHSEGSFIKWQLQRQRGFWPEWMETAPGAPPPHRVVDGRLRVTLINHATLLVQMDGMNILTDPIWSDRTSPVRFAGPRRHRAAGIRFENLPPIDLVVVSHNHYDHLDLPTLQRLQQHHRSAIVTPLGNGALMREHGIDGARELDWWQSTSVGTVTITSVPSKHFSARGLSDRDRNLWGGFVLSGPSGNLYFAGDTGWGGHFAEIGRRFAPIRLAMLPIGAYLPRWFMHNTHIDPEEAVEAHLALGAKTSVAMHYGTFRLSDEGMTDPVRDLHIAMKRKQVSNFLVLEQGEGQEVP